MSNSDPDQIPTPTPLTQSVEQRVLETCWLEAMENVRDAMQALRRAFPDHTQSLPETGERAMRSALHNMEDVLADLHRAGRHVLGEDVYALYLDDLED